MYSLSLSTLFGLFTFYSAVFVAPVAPFVSVAPWNFIPSIRSFQITRDKYSLNIAWPRQDTLRSREIFHVFRLHL